MKDEELSVSVQVQNKVLYEKMSCQFNLKLEVNVIMIMIIIMIMIATAAVPPPLSTQLREISGNWHVSDSLWQTVN